MGLGGQYCDMLADYMMSVLGYTVRYAANQRTIL